MKPLNERELTEREIKDLLTPRQRPVPSADLAERIKRDIPADLTVAPGLAGDRASTLSSQRIWLMAASVVIAVGGGFLALRWMDRMPAQGVTVAARMDEVTAEQEGERAAGSGERSAPVSKSEIAGAAAASTAPAASAAAEAAGGEALVGRLAAEADRSRQAEHGAADPALEGVPSEASGVDRDLGDVFAEKLQPLEEAEVQLDEARARQHASRRGELAQQERSARERRRDRQPVPAPAAPAPAVPKPKASSPQTGANVAERPGGQEEAQKREGVTYTRGARGAPPASPAPVASGRSAAGPREKRAQPSDDELRAFNARIGSENAQIDDMRAEARQLEAELKAFEEQSATSPAPAAVAPPSTGGTAEPNDAPYGDVFYESAGTNPFIDTEDDALSTFGLDVDTGSYTVTRRYLRDGHLPPHAAVRVEELINYFDYGDAAPEKEEFAIHAEGAPSIYGQGERYHLLRFNLSGRELHQAERRPALLTFVVDVSGSMGQGNRLGLVKQALALLIDQLRADDRLALVIYGSRGQVVLEPTSDHSAIRRAIDRLRTGGSTNAEEGLELAYEMAARHRRRGAINRVILCSDGVANVGATSAGSILERIRREADQGIELTTVGFGMGNYNDVLMERLADTGNGRYAYVDTLDEARRIFVENLTGTLQTLAAEARVQVAFDPGVVLSYRLLGYENRDIADQRFRDDTVDAGEIGVGHKVTALYEIKTKRPLRDADRVATLSLRYGSIERRKVVEIARTVTGADFARRWQAASPALKLTTLVAEYAEILKRSFWAREGDLDDVFKRAQHLSAQFEGDREVADFVSLVGRAAEYKEREQR